MLSIYSTCSKYFVLIGNHEIKNILIGKHCEWNPRSSVNFNGSPEFENLSGLSDSMSAKQNINKKRDFFEELT